MRFAAFLLVLSTCHSMLAARNDIVEGNPASAVRVLIYEDLQCGDCSRFETMLEDKLLPKYGGRVAFVHRDCPLGKHDWARQAAIASRWVYERDPALGIAFRRELLAEQNTITLQSLKPWMGEFAARHDLDSKGLLGSLGDARFAALVDQDLMAAAARSVTRTPTVYIGGQAFIETIVYEDIATALDELLK